MSLYEPETFETFLASLPAVTIVNQWGGASVGKVGGKIFAILSGWDNEQGPAINFKCSDLSFDMLPELDDVRPAKYLARAKWVAVGQAAPLSEDEIRAYIVAAHKLISAKLTRRVQAELGLTPDYFTTA